MLKFRPLNFIIVGFVRFVFISVSLLDKVFYSNVKIRNLKIKTGLLLLSVSFIVSSCNSNEEVVKSHENNPKKAGDGIAKNLRMPFKKRLSKMIWIRPIVFFPEPTISCYDVSSTVFQTANTGNISSIIEEPQVSVPDDFIYSYI